MLHDEKPLWQHLDDLRRCLTRCLSALLIGLVLVFRYIDKVMEFLEAPLVRYLPAERQHLYFTGVTDKFMTYLKVGCLVSFCLTSPFILYQVWLFVSPGLYRHEKRFAIPFVFFSLLSFAIGIAFAYYVILPTGFEFLMNFGSNRDVPMITLGEYFSFTLKMMVALGLIFEMPVVIVILGKLGIVTASGLAHYRRHAFVVISLVSAIATPSPDAISMILVMVPLVVLYEISIMAVRFVSSTPSSDKS